ncbi:tripartite tricarboxylate transporter substrate binding protein [Alkalihalobacterium alkalinitrilicum]|uniref:tripartite tricarboxylate transporter substrate binding protein n=1 Tax=Alkalihalobacterium alkalinitrilicum TaxID=427920 RepID=UPI0009955B9C|nr:tripartite tricarboxylate transporter substrate binding protein [Alkalihalobacterium alkalinitrilicum]
MKKNIGLLTLVLLLVLTAACSSSGSSTNSSSNSSTDSSTSSSESSEEANEEGEAAWPTDTVRLILPFSAGGSTDRMARSLASHWEKQLDGHSMIVENYGGSGGILGATQFLNAKDDGNTIFMGVQPTISMNILAQGADFSLDDFIVINIEQSDYADILVKADSPYETLEELIEDARNNPGKLSIGTAPGSGTQLFGLAFIDAFDVDINVVTYDGGGDVRTALLGGHIDLATGSAFGDMSLGDEVRVLAVASSEPFQGWPDAIPVNDALDNGAIPNIGDNRFIAVHRTFAENNPKAFEKLVETYRLTFESEEYQEHMKSTGSDIISQYLGQEGSKKVMDELHEVVDQYKDLLKGN